MPVLNFKQWSYLFQVLPLDHVFTIYVVSRAAYQAMLSCDYSYPQLLSNYNQTMNTKIAQDALFHYDLPDAQVIFIGQSQNNTFRVETPTGNKFLLRIHTGIGANKDDSQDVWQELPGVESI